MTETSTCRPYQAPSKPLVSQVQRSGIRDQVQGSGKSAAPDVAAVPPVENRITAGLRDAGQNTAVIRELALEVLRTTPPGSPYMELKELLKIACREKHIAY